jgi:hypothetical protein
VRENPALYEMIAPSPVKLLLREPLAGVLALSTGIPQHLLGPLPAEACFQSVRLVALPAGFLLGLCHFGSAFLLDAAGSLQPEGFAAEARWFAPTVSKG